MGLDWDKVLLSSSKISVSAAKQKHKRNRVANVAERVTITNPIAGKGAEKISIHKLKNSSGGKDFYGSKKIRNLNVNPHIVSVDNKKSTKSGVRGNSFSNPTPKTVPSPPRDSRKRSPHCSLLIHETPKSARTVSDYSSKKTPVCKSDRTPVNGSLANSRAGVLAPRSPHGRDILSFGNIYKVSKNSLSEIHSPVPNNVQVNDIVPKGSSSLFSGAITPNRSNNNIFGFGGLNYGHGSIIKCVKSLENSPSKPMVIGNSNVIGNHRRLVPRQTSDSESAIELKNAGDDKYRRGCFIEAISLYEKSIKLCPENAVCLNNKAAALAGLGKFTEAVRECIEAIKCDPLYSRAHYWLGTLCTRLGRVEDAKWHFKLSGCDIGSESMKRLLHIEDHLTKLKKAQRDENWELALAESTFSIEAGADVADQVVAAKAEALLKLHRAKEALDVLKATRNSAEGRSRKASKGTSLLLVLETQTYFYLGRFEEGVLAAKQAVDCDPNSKSLMWLIIATCVADARKAGNKCFKDGKYSEACKMYDKGLQYAPTNSVLLCNRAACRYELGQWEMAVEDCNAALRNHPKYFKALLRRAHSYAKLERWEESVRDYMKLSEAMPGDKAIYSSLLEVQMELKKANKNF